VSVYVFPPLFVGYAGWQILRGIEGAGWPYLLFPLAYLINLEVNLSLPLLMGLFSVLLYYLVLYERIQYLKRCKLCVALISVTMIDLFYLLSLTGYDLLMDTHSLIYNDLLWYSLFADLIVVVL